MQAQNDGMQYQIPASEYSALVDLYNSTGGAFWADHGGWLDPNANGWDGAEVSGVQFDADGNIIATGNVTGLYLGNNQLTGILPNSLGNLSQLDFITLAGNKITGVIPDSLGNLTQLTELHLDDNLLTGNIPDSLGNLTQLTLLWVHDNQLTGNIPASLGNLTQLNDLELGFNSLSGSIPDSLGSLTQLTHIGLSNNQLTGSIPDNLGTLTQLTILLLGGNQLTGSIPDGLGNLTQLQDLEIGNNQLTGTIPNGFGILTQLTTLWLDNNQLTGTIPDSFGTLTQLTSLWLNDNQLAGSIPDSLTNLTQLAELGLWDNQLTGVVPDLTGVLGSSVNITYNCLDISASPVSLTNIAQMIAAGVNIQYAPQNDDCNPTTVNIQVQANPSSDGTVSGGGIYASNSVVTVTATNDDCSSFHTWTVNGRVVSRTPRYAFTATTDETLTANFSPIKYSIKTINVPAEGGKSSGGGTISCGNSVTVKATPAKGFAFTKWTVSGSVVSTLASYKFTVYRNESLAANFKDIQKPTLMITNVTNGQRVSNTVFTVKGTASDNVGVVGVWCQINNGVWTKAATSKNFTNWIAANLVVISGTNWVQAYAKDAAGNVSLTNKADFISFLP